MNASYRKKIVVNLNKIGIVNKDQSLKLTSFESKYIKTPSILFFTASFKPIKFSVGSNAIFVS